MNFSVKFLSGFALGVMATIVFDIYMAGRKHRGRKKVLRGFKKLRNRGKHNV